MLKDFEFSKPVEKDDYKKKFKCLKETFSNYQQIIKEKNLKVIILFEGPSAAGKGSALSQIIPSLDPRLFKTYSITYKNDIERRKPWLYRYFIKLPPKGQISFFDRSWYQEIANKYVENELMTKDNFLLKIKSVFRFEKLLTDDNYLIIKFYIHITKKEQKKRLLDLVSKESTAWRVTKRDWKRNKNYDEYLKQTDKMLCLTNFSFAPWHIVDGTYKKNRNLHILDIITTSIKNHIENIDKIKTSSNSNQNYFKNNDFTLIKKPKIEEVDLNKSIDKKNYKDLLFKYQSELLNIQNKYYLKKIPAVIVFEGFDAAGKGGAIKRVASALDARGYCVNPISAPNEFESSFHYLFRFYKTLPKDGHFAIYDRSWYGRVMVERIEGFASYDEWSRAYREINEFEEELKNFNCAIIKFFLIIDKQTQLKRFESRLNTPSKQWKITQEDWRNREKWDSYQAAVDEMIALTSTDFAPWNIIPSNDKLYSRIEILKILTHSLKKHLKKYDL